MGFAYEVCLVVHIYALQEHYMVNTACFTDEIATILQQRYQGSGEPLLFLLHGLNTDSNNFSIPAEFQVLILSIPDSSLVFIRTVCLV